MRIQLNKITLAASILLTMAFTFTICEAAGGKSALVGRWESDKSTKDYMEFLSDGTGIVSMGSKSIAITWKVEKDRLYVTKSRSKEVKSFSYKISGSTLTITDDDDGDVDKLNKTEKCGNKWYYLATQSCKGNEIVNDKCNGKVYNLKTEYCLDNTVKKYGSVTHGGQQNACPNSVTDSNTVACGGKTYRTVKIGTQTWMAENLSFYTEGSEYHYEQYGRLYNWETAMKACPSGWHLPSNEDWDKLYRYADGTSGTESPYKSEIAGKYLKSKEGWKDNCNGLDVFGFSALPGGYGRSNGHLDLVGYFGNWWSSSEYDSGNAYSRSISEYESARYGRDGKGSLQSVRCLQD
jgi:uncharacterized protein (TIGR02145 family)